MKKKTTREIRKELTASALIEVRKIVKKFDLPAVQAAVKQLYDERKAAKELREAEAKVALLRKKLG